MPRSCCVPGYKSNYYKGEYILVFSFPSDLKNSEGNMVVTKNTSVCVQHFRDNQIIRETRATRPDMLTSQINMDVPDEVKLRHEIRREQRKNRRRRRRNEVGSCVICQEKVLRNVSSVLTCGHYFHTQCIFAWINVSDNTSCPTCRAPVECYHI